jgi:DNA mismatch repair protein MutH
LRSTFHITKYLGTSVAATKRRATNAAFYLIVNGFRPIACDQRHCRGPPQIATAKESEKAMTRLTWQEYFEQTVRVQLQNLAARQASGRELIERLRAIATDYKRVLFNDNSS